MTNPPDAGPWIRGATRLGATTLEEATDPGFKARVAWQLAVALCDAVEIEAARDRAPQALELGKLAIDCFDQGDIAGRELTGGDYVRGRLLYRLGALEAVERADHKAAVAWFDQALARLERPLPASAAANRGRHGEMLVSMAISYWEVSKRGEALRLTERGAKLMEQAASDGQLSRPALAVPYGNLAAMHEKLGRTGDAKKYSVLAASYQEQVAAPEPRKKPKIIQGNPAVQ
jgi:tetratricopeptide (TPR) repeat protein